MFSSFLFGLQKVIFVNFWSIIPIIFMLSFEKRYAHDAFLVRSNPFHMMFQMIILFPVFIGWMFYIEYLIEFIFSVKLTKKEYNRCEPNIDRYNYPFIYHYIPIILVNLLILIGSILYYYFIRYKGDLN